MTTATITIATEELPPHDPSHGTNQQMIRRTIEFELPSGTSTWEQTDYGHAGRFNPWEPRRIDAKLQSKADQLRLVAELMGNLADG